jgi:hypothetical protein
MAKKSFTSGIDNLLQSTVQPKPATPTTTPNPTAKPLKPTATQKATSQPVKPTTTQKAVAKPLKTTTTQKATAKQAKPVVPVPNDIEKTEMAGVYFRLPVSLKVELFTYCVQRRIAVQNFLTDIIQNAIS